MTKERLLSLIVKRLDGELTAAEAVELDGWADGEQANRQWLDRMGDQEALEREVQQWRNIDPERGFAVWLSGERVRRQSRIRRIAGWSAAASVLIAAAIFGLSRKAEEHPLLNTASVTRPVLPGTNTATLTLANGQKLLLDSAGAGDIALQGNTRLVKLDSGSLSYALNHTGKEEPVAYNVLTTPRSGQYQVILPDGSHVWLNNVSSLRSPTSFPGKNRTVELTGEAYFEIAAHPEKPFIVKVNGEEGEDLGTSPKIKAYTDEKTIQTTLLTGAVRVKAENSA